MGHLYRRIGKVSYLPGQIRDILVHINCDKHEGVPAVKRIIGDCDSFGHEESYVCQECLDKHLKYMEDYKPPDSMCDWCKGYPLQTRPIRDFEEGYNGPVYYVCEPCCIRHHQQCHGSD